MLKHVTQPLQSSLIFDAEVKEGVLMFGFSKKERFEREVSNLVGLSHGLSREIRALLIKRHPDLEVFIESQPRSINAIHYMATAISQFSWLMHSKGRLPMDELLDEFHLAVMKETMKERNFDTPPQILLDKRADQVELFYMQLEEDAFQQSNWEGSLGRGEAAQQLFSLVLHALDFSKKYL